MESESRVVEGFRARVGECCIFHLLPEPGDAFGNLIPKMDYRYINSLRLAGTVLSILLLVQLPQTYASAIIMQSMVCGTDDLTYYSNTNGDESFHINGKLADRNIFCNSLLYHYKVGCIFEGFLRKDKCGLDLSAVDLPVKHGRKMLLSSDKEETEIPDSARKINPKDGKNDSESSLSSIKVVMVGSGILAAFCGLLCPCCWRKRKAATHTVVSKELSSSDSISSLQMKSVSEKILGSPLRAPQKAPGSPLRAPQKVPGSPLRVPQKIPGSPHRVPPSPRFSMSPKLSRLGSVHLSLHEVAKATQNFSPRQQIGEGGFGKVYKAELEDGQVVAVKRAKKEYFDNLKIEFSSEVELLAKIDHRSLVKLLGYVDKGNERLLITEYVPNGNLREHLDGKLGRILDFNQRLEIAIDVAHGLTYLHLYAEKQIIHRDVKASNILLTETMRAKVADFGFARIGRDGDHTHISTNVKGTVGYLDPEYMKTNQLTPRSDVHSFGILLIEILTGRRPVEVKRPAEERVTLRWVFRKYSEGSVVQLVDPLMHEAVDVEILVKIFGLAIQCAAPVRSDRPDMKSVGEQLWGIRADYLKSVRRG